MLKESKGPVKLIYREPHPPFPVTGEDDPWLHGESFDDDGTFFGTGGANTPTG